MRHHHTHMHACLHACVQVKRSDQASREELRAILVRYGLLERVAATGGRNFKSCCGSMVGHQPGSNAFDR